MFCSKCGAQNADGAGFCSSCGSPLQPAPEEKKDCAADTKSELPDAAQPGAAVPGTLSAKCKYAERVFTVMGRLKWAAVDQMNPYQLVLMLKDMKAYAERLEAKYRTADAYKAECDRLARDLAENKKNPLFFAISVVACVVCWILMQFNDLFMFFFGMLLFAAIIFTIAYFVGILKYIKARANFARDYEPTARNYRQAVQAVLNEHTEYADDVISGLVILPDYYQNVSALDFMINALSNHRAATLGSAVNLYEEHMEDLRRRGILKDQLAEARRASAAAESAAIAAKSAAASASTTAYNSFRK